MYASLDRQREHRPTRADEGYTLIELLVIILILAVLAGIAVFALDSVTGSASKASCEFDVQTVDHAVLAYRAQMTADPHAIIDLETAQTDPGGFSVGPWLHNQPTNGKHYEITLANGSTAYNGWTTSPISFAPAGTVVLESWNTQTNNWNSAPDGYVYAPPSIGAGATVNGDGPFTTPQNACNAFGAG